MRAVFLGLGRRSRDFLAKLPDYDGIEVVAGADTWEAARLHAEKACRGIQTYETPEALFREHEDIDLALVFSRDVEHEACVLAALANGADVFVEKPMATTPEACRNMIRAAREAGRRLMVGFNLRFHPTVLEARAFLDAGRAGRLRAIWEWHEVDLNYFHNWMSVRALSAGLLFQKGSHDFDLINWFAQDTPLKVAAFGGLDYHGGTHSNDLHCPACPERKGCPESVGEVRFPSNSDPAGVPNLEQMKCAFRKEIDVCDNHVVNLLYAKGIKASYTEIHASPLPQRRFVLFGEKGRLEFDVGEPTLCWRPRDRSCEPERWPAASAAGGHGGADGRMTDAIVSVFRDGAPVPVTGEDGLNAVLVSHAAETAIGTQQVMDLDS